ncbi:kynurenine formamidase-like isoform X2 [Sitophilus oryzae]|uniref:Kynurenine formamidase-like isoform X2 n=1 Tax=Sitophilus oryzae TaxID=7048 RepID=A0A6J2Y5D8_SITOR|nr:kynurenine formamidase-like isoform X2 [Sitophilus oryzae]
MSTGEEIESFYTPSWWTRRYTKETVVGIHLELINKKSEELLRTIPCKLDVQYGCGPREKYNIIGTDLENDSPILIHVHGGYYQEERISHSSHAFIANALYKNHIKTITIGYELCPKKEVTEILTDLSAGIKECIKYGLSWAYSFPDILAERTQFQFYFPNSVPI